MSEVPKSTPLQDAAEEAAIALTALSIQSKPDDSREEIFEIPQRFTKSGRKRATPFPLKLMKVLSNKQLHDIISWTPTGKSFVILQPKIFVSEVLPEHFKSAKYSSFTRKLHRWGFMRHFRGEESGAFYHKDFQKDRLDLVETMTCKTEPPKSSAAMKKKDHVKVISEGSRPNKPTTTQPLSKDTTTEVTRNSVAMKANNPHSDIVASRIDAAIEAEVSRRLQERVQQAALSRMFMRQQLNTPVIPLGLRLQLLEMQQKKLGAMGGGRVPLTGLPLQDRSGVRLLPRTNIEGAKTA